MPIAFEEAALNIIGHGAQVEMTDICLLLEDGNLIVRIRDNGLSFDSLGYEDEEDILRINNIHPRERRRCLSTGNHHHLAFVGKTRRIPGA